MSIKTFFSAKPAGMFGMFDIFSGGALKRMSIFALGIVPYISASIMMQLFQYMVPAFKELHKEGGEAAKNKLSTYTKYLTLIICIVQSFAVVLGLESIAPQNGMQTVVGSGVLFKAVAVITLTAGTFFILWMGERITERGIGNGVSLIIFAGIVSNLPTALSATLTLGEKGVLSPLTIIFILVMIVAVVYGVVFVETAQRRVLVNYPRRVAGRAAPAQEASYLPIKINNSGVIPPIFASSILLLPATIIGFLKINSQSSWFVKYSYYFSHGQIGYLILYSLLIAFFAFFYVSIVFNATETADNLKKSGGVILGIRPGEGTANYLNQILSRITMLGVIYLVIVCLLPEILISKLSIPFYFGGTSLLIIVSVTLDTVTQVQTHILSSRYQGLIKKTRLGRR